MEQQPPIKGGDESDRARIEADWKRKQRFHFGPWLFNVNRALAITAESPRAARRLPVKPWARFYGLAEREGTSFSIFGPRNLDPAYALTSDLSEPVLVATLRNQAGEEFPLLIDGTHRLYRAYVEHVAALPAYVLTVEETLAIREDGYLGRRGARS